MEIAYLAGIAVLVIVTASARGILRSARTRRELRDRHEAMVRTGALDVLAAPSERSGRG
ncbi:hypothetical protein [Microbacterium gilvum]|uniref:Uncharacterized protein n=1 Tax=Microbacterium gilvum TaxID=1336204 RepID=A0ABP9AVR9_9MICO